MENNQTILHQPNIMVIDKNQKSPLVIVIAIPTDGNIRKKKYDKDREIPEARKGIREEN